jgi:hypothetical protein
MLVGHTQTHSNCIHTRGYSMMTSLDDKIAALEVSIAQYENMLKEATSEERKDNLLAAITAKEVRLHDLFIQKSQQGK